MHACIIFGICCVMRGWEHHSSEGFVSSGYRYRGLIWSICQLIYMFSLNEEEGRDDDGTRVLY